MIKPFYKISLLLSLIALIAMTFPEKVDWGFYGHRTINRLAVFSLPVEMIPFYKKHIDYITEHAVDPDKRRYATVHEGVRHYIDIDVWGEYPFNNVPRRFDRALMKYAKYYHISGTDTLELNFSLEKDSIKMQHQDWAIAQSLEDFSDFWKTYVTPQYYEESWIVEDAVVKAELSDELPQGDLHIEDHFSQEGILPYHLLTMKYKLTDAFKRKDQQSILRLSAEFGHYIGDAHVPLHTTVNYNGQLTDQVGIHAFWESRIPELFAERQYDFLVGRADYIEKPSQYFWNIILRSHSLLEDVLKIEKELSKSFPEDQQYCYDERLERTIRIQCPEYAAAYQKAMGGMVEERMTESVKAIADVWYTCWVDAGQPYLENMEITEVGEQESYPIDPSVKSKARNHDF